MPKNKTDPATRTNGQIEEEVTLTAVVRKTEKVCTYVHAEGHASLSCLLHGCLCV